MEINSEVPLKMEGLVDLDQLSTFKVCLVQMEVTLKRLIMKGCGRLVKEMDKERLLGLMEVVFLVFGRMISEYKER